MIWDALWEVVSIALYMIVLPLGLQGFFSMLIGE
jgi:hypothetical protein